jgi:hypothetical protein
MGNLKIITNGELRYSVHGTLLTCHLSSKSGFNQRLPEQKTDILNVTSDSRWQTRRIFNTFRNYAQMGLPHKQNFLIFRMGY